MTVIIVASLLLFPRERNGLVTSFQKQWFCQLQRLRHFSDSPMAFLPSCCAFWVPGVSLMSKYSLLTNPITVHRCGTLSSGWADTLEWPGVDKWEWMRSYIQTAGVTTNCNWHASSEGIRLNIHFSSRQNKHDNQKKNWHQDSHQFNLCEGQKFVLSILLPVFINYCNICAVTISSASLHLSLICLIICYSFLISHFPFFGFWEIIHRA